jgi:hypothetical protein
MRSIMWPLDHDRRDETRQLRSDVRAASREFDAADRAARTAAGAADVAARGNVRGLDARDYDRAKHDALRALRGLPPARR